MRLPSDAGAAGSAHDPRQDTITSLVRRLIDDGRAYARAELALVKQIARHRAARAKSGALLLGVGIVLLLCAQTALVLALVLGLATLVGPFAGGLVVCLTLALLGGLLVRAGITGLSAIRGDDEENAALAAPELRS